MSEKSIYETLSKIDVSKYIDKKGKLSYLSWAWAWGKLKEHYPLSEYHVYENNNGRIYWDDGKTCWVKTGVTINTETGYSVEHIEYLPIMDFRNASIPLDKVTSMDANKTIQRSLTKAIARHGLGLFIYAGEDLPEIEVEKVDFKKRISQVEEIKRLLAVNSKEMSKEEKLSYMQNKTGVKTFADYSKMDNEKLDKIIENLKSVTTEDLNW